ncbi:MAG: hypothetical protein HYX74_02080 [Acidobacteria bacterium]|nr:hypothetical protein [Acidobacteriota bacterium]
MRAVVHRNQNKVYYRILHVPIWIWVFFVLPGHLAHDLFAHGADRRHWIWLAIVSAVCAWRGWRGRLPGAELRPYITHFGEDKPNLPYRRVCYTAAWIDLLVPFVLNVAGLSIGAATGVWMLGQLYGRLYYPLALLVLGATLMDRTPRARRSTAGEGAEWAWFYVALWTIVPAEVAGWGMWRLGTRMGLQAVELTRLRLGTFFLVAAMFFLLGLREKLGRTRRYYPEAPAELQSQV